MCIVIIRGSQKIVFRFNLVPEPVVELSNVVILQEQVPTNLELEHNPEPVVEAVKDPVNGASTNGSAATAAATATATAADAAAHAHLQSWVHQLKLHNTHLEEKLSELQSQLDFIKIQYKQELGEKDALVEGLNQTVSARDTAIKDHVKERLELEALLSASNARVSYLQDKLTLVENNRNELQIKLNTQVSDTNQLVGKYTAQIQSLEKTVLEHKILIDNHVKQEQLASMSIVSTANSSGSGSSSVTNASALSRIEALQSKLLKEMTQRQELEQQLTINTHKIVLKEEELMIAQEEKGEAERANRDLMAQNRNLQVGV